MFYILIGIFYACMSLFTFASLKYMDGDVQFWFSMFWPIFWIMYLLISSFEWVFKYTDIEKYVCKFCLFIAMITPFYWFYKLGTKISNRLK